jgi:hypothetical protein
VVRLTGDLSYPGRRFAPEEVRLLGRLQSIDMPADRSATVVARTDRPERPSRRERRERRRWKRFDAID